LMRIPFIYHRALYCLQPFLGYVSKVFKGILTGYCKNRV
jgi:hypothetical protein